MLYLFIGSTLVLGLYAAACTTVLAYIYGQSKLMNKMVLDSKRGERRATRNATAYLAKLMEKAGVPIYRRVHHDPGTEPQPSRSIVPISAAVERQRNADYIAPKGKTEKVPQAIKTPFLTAATDKAA